jgi:murein DD-endopeptidase MepM/ murein hydrolase activator NlpD
VTSTPPLHALAGTPPAPQQAGGAPDPRRVEQLAQEFEAMLMLQMVRQMRQALLDEQQNSDGLGAGTMTETFDVEFARYLSAVGGIGLTRLLTAHLPAEPEAAPAGSAGRTDVGAATAAEPAMRSSKPAAAGTVPALRGTEGTGEHSPLAVPLEAPISSAYGWRTDPFLGTRRFHGGIDLRAAYGREVPSVAAGRVVFAGEQGAYGQTVVVEHADGMQTRYAHLSAVTVRAGEQLAGGHVVGRVGQSGRATGPHLHFEVSRDGRRLDPLAVAGVLDRTSAGGP